MAVERDEATEQARRERDTDSVTFLWKVAS
jgi:hypothetical protein